MTETTLRTSPSLLSWIAALASGALLLIALWSSVTLLIDYRKESARRELSQSIGERDIGRIRSRVLHAIGSWGSMSKIIDQAFNLSHTLDDSVSNVALENCISALEAISRNDATLAQRFVQTLSDPQFDSLATQFSTEGSDTWETMRSAMQRAAFDYKKASLNWNEAKKEIESAEKQLSSFENEYYLVGNDLSFLLGMSLARNRDSSDSIYPFYREGILAFLPELRNIPDGIETYTTLKKFLDAHGGRVREEKVEDPHADFTNRLETIRSASKEVYARSAVKLAEIDHIRRSGDAKRGELSEKREVLRRALSTLILAIVT